jgi:hypothetical protein
MTSVAAFNRLSIKAGRATERESSRSQASNRKKATQTPSLSAMELLEQDHRQVEEWFDEYDQLKGNDKQKASEPWGVKDDLRHRDATG